MKLLRLIKYVVTTTNVTLFWFSKPWFVLYKSLHICNTRIKEYKVIIFNVHVRMHKQVTDCELQLVIEVIKSVPSINGRHPLHTWFVFAVISWRNTLRYPNLALDKRL